MPVQGQTTQLLKPGHNCWALARAERLAFLIDGEAYFRAFHQAVRKARHSVFILGWDIDTRLRLLREPFAEDGVPNRLGEVLHLALKQNRKLHIHILVWDWAMLYAGERQWMPLYSI